eukprot:scaffold3428_cov379-Prasinococcus_capsulatus_cf.AAC.33
MLGREGLCHTLGDDSLSHPVGRLLARSQRQPSQSRLSHYATSAEHPHLTRSMEDEDETNLQAYCDK